MMDGACPPTNCGEVSELQDGQKHLLVRDILSTSASGGFDRDGFGKHNLVALKTSVCQWLLAAAVNMSVTTPCSYG